MVYVGCSIMSMTTRCSRRRLSYGLEGDEQSSQAVVCALCKLNHKHMSKVHTWQSAQACEVAVHQLTHYAVHVKTMYAG